MGSSARRAASECAVLRPDSTAGGAARHDGDVSREGSAGLRHGWTTGACATAATTAAYTALLTGEFPDPVQIDLPNDRHPSFALATERLEDGAATVGVVKDAGDDPDVTHGALVSVRVTH